MRTGIIGLALASTLALAGPAQAQTWGDSRGGWNGGYQNGYGYGYRDNRFGEICSGRRADRLEDKLRHEQREGELDRTTARRIHDEIDQLEHRQRDECREGDGRELSEIAFRYDRIERWIESAAHSDQGYGWRGRMPGGWRRGW